MIHFIKLIVALLPLGHISYSFFDMKPFVLQLWVTAPVEAGVVDKVGLLSAGKPPVTLV